MKQSWNFLLIFIVLENIISTGNCSRTASVVDGIWDIFKSKNSSNPETMDEHLDIEKNWNAWKDVFNRNYPSIQDELKRRQIFAKRLKLVEENNKKFENGQISYKMELTKYADLSFPEFEKQATGLKLAQLVLNVGQMQFPSFNLNQQISPDFLHCFLGNCNLDWRTKSGVSPVKDQKNCGSCWVFASVAAIESQLLMKSKKLQVLSEQQIIDCDNRQENGCNGGDPFELLNSLIGKGITDEASYPYKSRKGPKCLKNLTQENFIVTGQTSNYHLGGSESKLQNLVTTYGPTVVALHASENFLMYKSGIFIDDTCNLPPNHAVLVCGFGKKGNLDYWLIKNSWGEKWGEDGYMKIARNKNNMCGIANYGSVPSIRIL